MFSKSYLPSEINISINDNPIVVETLNRTTSYDSLMQVVKYNMYSSTLQANQSITLMITSKHRTLRWGIKTGTIPNYSIQQLVYIPIDMFLFHGAYWSNMFYDWIFFVIPFTVAILYISSSRGYNDIIATMAIYAACGFSATAFAKLYHIILSCFRLSDLSESIFSITVLTLVVEILPIAFCFQHIYVYKSKPLIQGLFSIVLSVLLLLAGASYYIGTGFLLLAGICTLIFKSLLPQIC
jgi:hypothetical protein